MADYQSFSYDYSLHCLTAMTLEVLQILMKRTAEGQRKTLMLNTLGEVQTQRSAHILISLTAEQQKSILN